MKIKTKSGIQLEIDERITDDMRFARLFSKLRKNNTACIERYIPKDPLTHQGIYIDIFPYYIHSIFFLQFLFPFENSHIKNPASFQIRDFIFKFSVHRYPLFP